MIKARRPLSRQKTTPIYNIGAVSRLTGLAIWTVRWIERHELVAPERTEGNQRLFSDADVELLQEIRSLLEEGVNLAGIRVILRMRVSVETVQERPAARPAGSPRSAKRKISTRSSS